MSPLKFKFWVMIFLISSSPLAFDVQRSACDTSLAKWSYFDLGST